MAGEFSMTTAHTQHVWSTSLTENFNVLHPHFLELGKQSIQEVESQFDVSFSTLS